MSPLWRQFTDKKFSIRFTLLTVFLFATLLTASIAVGLQYVFTKRIATDAAIVHFNDLADKTSQYLDQIDSRAAQADRFIAANPSLISNNWVNDQSARDLFAQIMRHNAMFYAIYYGFTNGDFYELINLNTSSQVRKQLHAQLEDRWAMIEISGQGAQRTRRYSYYDDNFRLRHHYSEYSDYDATQRPWFVQAEAGKVNKTAPYLFHNLQAPGQTYSTHVKGSKAVIAVDIALSSQSDFLNAQQVGKGARLFLYQQSGELIASNGGSDHSGVVKLPERLDWTLQQQSVIDKHPVLSVSNELDWAPIDFTVAGTPHGYSIDFLSLISAMTGIEFHYVNGYNWTQLVERFEQHDIDLLQPVFKNDINQSQWLFSRPFLTVPYALVTRQGEPKISNLNQVSGWTLAIPKGWSIIDVLHKHYPGIHIKQVASTYAVLQAVSNKQADAGLDVATILHYTAQQYYVSGLQFDDNIDFSPVAFPNQLHLVLHQDQTELMAVLNQAIKHVTKAQQQQLTAKWFDQTATTGTVPYPELITLAEKPQAMGKLHSITIAGQPHFIYVAATKGAEPSHDYFAIVIPQHTVLGPSMHKVMLSVAATIIILLVLSPLCWLFSSPIVSAIRSLTDENEKIKRRDYQQVARPHSRIKEIHELGESMLTMSAAIEQHEFNQRALMDAFVELIAQAIDDKSPYTAGHCERVPQLAFMLAEKAEQSNTGPFSEFAFESAEAWREFKIAAWLHDCGKITTPEHIVDKGSKLETIYNRIHEIRMRFEVLLRDAEIAFWQQVADNPEKMQQLRVELDRRQQRINDDFAFIAQSNIGGEYLSEHDKQRIKQIAATTWQRRLSNRLGLSPLEQKRLIGDEPRLPVMEALLSDRPEHLFPHQHDTGYDPSLGIKMPVPDYQYNQGELYNLLIERGTLTTEDRFKINEHIIATIKMLESLPLPMELAKVPRYASTHHETMDGRGYPRQLHGDDLSIPERIMVLADIFEALTAADRPYKTAKTLSESLAIMHKMVLDQHIDRDVFELFLRSGVYLDYARRFLAPEQNDDVDINDYLQT